MPVTLSPVSDVAEVDEFEEADATLQPFSRSPNNPELMQQFRLLQHHMASQLRQRIMTDDPCPIAFVGSYGDIALQALQAQEQEGGEEEEDETGSPGSLTSASSVEEDESLQEAGYAISELRSPGPCSYLTPGQTFHGSQKMYTSLGGTGKDWGVIVKIQSVNLATGYICGAMEARNVPNVRASVTTFWEGDIVDNINHTLFTQKYGASRDTDLTHWRKFPGFSKLASVGRDGRSTALESCGNIYMRWKEVFFVKPSESRMLTIQGFYYVVMERQSGKICGFYYDPNSTPFQRLFLSPSCQVKAAAAADGTSGMSFASFDFK